MADEEIGIQETTAQGERPSWLPSNFESPEDLAKSYSHATKKITEQGQQLSQLQQQIEAIQASQQEVQTQQYGQDLESQLYEAFESGDGRTAAAAAAFLAKQAVEQALAAYQPPVSAAQPELVAQYALTSAAQKHQDWAEVESDVQGIINSNKVLSGMFSGPNTTPSQAAEALDTAYKLAKYERGQTAQSEATDSLSELARLTKQQAQTMSGTNSVQEQESMWDEIQKAKSGIPSFRR